MTGSTAGDGPRLVPHAPPVDAWLVCPDGGDLPEAAWDALKALGWRVERLGVDHRAANDAAPILLWAPGGWELGLSAVHSLRSNIRGRAIVVSQGPPLVDLGHRVRSASALSYWRAPWGGWLLELARSALARDAVEPGSALLDRLRDQAVERPESFLVALGMIASTLLKADQMEAVVRLSDGELRRLDPAEGDGDSVVASPRRTEGARTPPLEVVDKALAFDQVVAVPDVRFAPAISGGDEWRAALGIPVHQDEGAAPSSPAAALAFYWREPRLITPRELWLARILAVAAEASWARLVERDRLTRSHLDSLQALGALPWAQGEISGESTTEQDDTALFIRRSLRARAGIPRLDAFYANPSTSSRGHRTWLRVEPGGEERPATDDEKDRLEDFVDSDAGHDQPRLQPGGRWWQSVRLRAAPGGRSLGNLVAVYPDRAAGRLGHPDLLRLSADLSVGLRLLRRSSDNAALVDLSRLLSDATEPRQTLDQMAEIIRRQLSADGVKVFIVAEGHHNSRIEQLYRTNQRTQGSRSAVIDKERGLADWVVLHEDWVIVEHPVPVIGEPVPPAEGVSGSQGNVRIPPRTETEFWEGTVEDVERCQIMVPLHHRGRIAGVLACWRTDAHRFDAVLDVETMASFSPHVASACARVKAMERTEGELQAITRLARDLSPATTLREADQLVLDEAVKLSGAHLAVLLRHDTAQPGTLGVTALHGSVVLQRREKRTLSGEVVDWGQDPTRWGARAAEWIACGPASQPAERRLVHHVVLPGGAGDRPLGLVLLTHAVARPSPIPLFAAAATWRAVDTFLQYAGLLLANHVGVHANALVEEISRSGAAPTDPLVRAADRMRRTLHDAVVVVSRGVGNRQEVSWTGPPLPSLMGSAVDTSVLARDPKPDIVREVDLEASESRVLRTYDPHFITNLQEAANWRGVRSWMAVPIVHGNHLMGLVQILTPRHGTVLGAAHARVAATLAAWAAEELVKAQRHHMLEDLNRIATGLAGSDPHELESGLAEQLRTWSRSYLHRAVQVAVVARSGPNHELITSATRGLEGSEVFELSKLSLENVASPMRWDKAVRPGPDVPGVQGRFAGLGAPLRLASGSALQGHLIVLHSRPFDDDDQAIVGEAAREMSVLLHGEVVRHEWKLQAGLFRHALLGPVQGLQSAATYLHALATMPDAPQAELDRAQDQIALETETLRLWRETQRIYTMVQNGQEPDIRPRRQELRALVLRCIERYSRGLDERGITLELDWPRGGGLMVDFDENAVDLILCNLLDNARKYTFYHRTVSVGVVVGAEAVHLWVENVGAEIPDELEDTIYEAGTRRQGRDPVRAIAGEGLGLYLARALARAHGGDLTHACEPMSSRRDARTPYRVRFTLGLPHHWSRGPRRDR